MKKLYLSNYVFTLKLGVYNDDELNAINPTIKVSYQGGDPKYLDVNQQIKPNTVDYLLIKFSLDQDRPNSGTAVYKFTSFSTGISLGTLNEGNNVAQKMLVSLSEGLICNYVLTVDINTLDYYTKDAYPFCHITEHPCLEGYQCRGTQCNKCIGNCRTCVDNVCKKCEILSTIEGNAQCSIDYTDLSLYENIKVSIPPPRSNRVTLGFWTFIDDLQKPADKKVALNVAVRDFLVITIGAVDSTHIIGFCTVNEKYHKNVMNSELYDVVQQLKPEEDKVSVSVPDTDTYSTIKEVSGRWFYSQCAMSYDHRKYEYYIMMNNKRLLQGKELAHETLYDFGNNNKIQNDPDVYFRNFYKDNEKGTLEISNAAKFNSKVYIKNLIIYSEYIPYEMRLYYFDIPKFNLAKDDFPEVIFFIPFDDYKSTNPPTIEGKEFTNDNTNNGTITITLTPINPVNFIIQAPRNFKRLILANANKQFDSPELLQQSDFTPAPNSKFNFDYSKAYCCENNYWLDLSDFSCNSDCPTKFTAFPGNSIEKGYCNYECQGGLNPCPRVQTIKKTESYPCDSSTNTISFYYQCLPKTNDYKMYYSSLHHPGSVQIFFNQRTTYKSYIIEIWYYPDYTFKLGDYLKSQDDNNKNYVFYSNSLRLYLNKGYHNYTLEARNGEEKQIETDPTQPLFIYPYEWNKLVFNVKYENLQFHLEFTTNNNPFNKISLTPVSSNMELVHILFCHNDPECVKVNDNERVFWGSGFYKNLRVWDGSKAQPFVTVNYDTIYPDINKRAEGIIIYYPLSMMYIKENVLTDPKSNANSESEQIIYPTNIWNLQKYNFSTKFDATIGGLFYVDELADATFKRNSCNSACFRCWTSDITKCYECNNNYYLHYTECIPIGSVSTFYRSPNESDKDLELVIDSTFKRGTTTFWLKPFGFTDIDTHIISYGSNLRLVYSAKEDNYGLSLQYSSDTTTVASNYETISIVPNFRDLIGQWVFISLAYWTEITDTQVLTYFPPMMKFEINENSYKVGLTNGDIPKNARIDAFVITNKFFGLISKLSRYDDYIIGAYGLLFNNINSDYPLYRNILYFPFGSTNQDCILSGHLIDTSISYTCVTDYDKRFTNRCDTKNNNVYQYLLYSGGKTTCKDCSSTCLNHCSYSEDTIEEGDYSHYCSCKNKNNNSQMIVKNGGINYCQKLEYYNFANVNDVTFTGVKTAKPTLKYTMQLWVWASDYIAGNFQGIKVQWNKHSIIEITQPSAGTLFFVCYPTDQNTNLSSQLSFVISEWNYISCASDFTTMKYYMNTWKSNYMGTINISTPSFGETTTLSITDKNKNKEWGVVFIKSIRLWNDCYHYSDFLARVDIETPSLFPSLMHLIIPTFTEVIPYTLSDVEGTITTTITRIENYGMNVVDTSRYSNLLMCKEEGQYYQSKPEKCMTFLDMAQMEDISFDGISPSYTGSYTMAFWIFVSNNNDFNIPVSVLFEEHIEIVIEVSSSLNAICFPQAYLKSTGNDINTRFTNALNKDRVQLSSTSGEWSWVICSVANYDMKYILNERTNKLNAEMLFKDQQNDYPYRYYFPDGAKKKLLITNLNKNNARIYLRSLFLFNDFIPYEHKFINLKYIDLTKIIEKRFQSLLFSTNFADIKEGTTATEKILPYYVYDDSSKLNKQVTLKHPATAKFELSSNFNFLPLCEPDEKYNPSTNECDKITISNLNSLHATHCIDDNMPLTCTQSFYLNNEISGTTCRDKCPSGLFRLPGQSIINRGICNTKCPENAKKCPNTSTGDLQQYNTIECLDGFVRIGLKCVEESSVSNSAFYYSRCYNQPNFHRFYTDTNYQIINSLNGYFLEVWIKIDPLNFDSCQTEAKESDNDKTISKYHYLFTDPHEIYFDSSTNLFYYVLKESYKKEINLNKKEWNIVIIKTEYASKKEVNVYLNYNINNPIVTITPADADIIKLIEIAFCTSTANGECRGTKYMKWGSAYYRNFRIWDLTTSTIEMVQAFGQGMFTTPIKSLKIFYPFTIDYLDNGIIQDKISSTSNIDTLAAYNTGLSSLYTIDKSLLYNYSTKFDWGATHANKYITGNTDGVITYNNCGTGCKRCYSSSTSDCYQCDTGYILKGKTCKTISKFFVKLPIGSGGSLKLQSSDNYNLENSKALTVTFFIKIFGVKSDYSQTKAPIFTIEDQTELYMNWVSSTLNMDNNMKAIFQDREATQYLGKWIPIAIASYVSDSPSVYPHMFTLSIDKIDMPFDANFDIPFSGIPIKRLEFGKDIVGLIGSLRVYSKFIQGAYGRIMADTTLRNNDLLFEIPLSGTSDDSCLLNAYVDTTVSDLKVECYGDYIDYLDESKMCNDNNKYFDIDLQTCVQCDSSCTTTCFGKTSLECTCDLSEGKYWLKRKDLSTYCEHVPYVDFSSLEQTVVATIESSTTNESTLEFWLYIYSYNQAIEWFSMINIEWHLHNRVVIKKESNTIKSLCYPLVDVNNLNKYLEYSTQTIQDYKWIQIRCGTNLNTKEFSHSIEVNNPLQKTLVATMATRPDTTIFQIYNAAGSENSFGFVFLKNIRLWQQYNFKYIDTSYINLISYDKFPGLLSYYKNNYDGQMTIVDDIDKVYTRITRQNTFRGYNYVLDKYTEELICDERLIVNNNKCESPQPNSLIPNCELYGMSGICIYCSPTYLLLSNNGTCSTYCDDLYYKDFKMNQCRPCHYTCNTCDGPLATDCTSCSGIYYFNSRDSTCIERCESIGLISQPGADGKNNKCGAFDVEAHLVNVNEVDPIDIRSFNYIEAAITGTLTVTVTFKWGFDQAKTIIENNNDPTFSVGTNPFSDSVQTQLVVNVKNDFFEIGRKYVFYLELTVTKGTDTVTVQQYWTLTMNDRPKEGELVVIPSIGLRNTTSFILDCKNWVDDNTVDLKYKFYYQEENTLFHTIIQDWSSTKETFSMIDVRNYQQPTTKITVYCEIKDKFEASSITSYEITIANSLSNGYYTIANALNDYTLPYAPTDSNLLGRSLLLKSLGVDPYKSNSPLFRQSYFEPSLDKVEIILHEPECNEDYCNSYGTCELVDTFLACSCQMGYIGTNCQLDKNGYVALVGKYQELFTKLTSMLQDTISTDKLTCIHNLFEGASYFIQEDSFFRQSITSFISIAKALTYNTIVTDLPFYLDLYNYYYTSVIYKIVQEKASIKMNTQSTNRTVKLPDDSISQYNEPIEYIITELESLLIYVIREQKTTQTSYEYSTDFLYVALTQINPTFNDESFFEGRKEKYKSHVNFMKCVNYIEIENLKNPYYQAWFGFIEFQTYPYFYNQTLYENNTSPYVSFFFYDATTAKVIPINNCTGDNAIILNFPFTSYKWLEQFNRQKSLYDPVNYKGSYNEVFNDPIYINKSGYVSDDTISDRIEKYHRLMNLSCQYYYEKNNSWSVEGIDYINFTSDTNFLVCNSDHATRFTSFFVPNNITYGTGTRFYYLRHPELFKYAPNYISNIGFWVIFGVGVFCLLLLLIFTYIDCNFFRQKSLLEFLKKEIVKAHFPYNQKTEKELNELIPNACDPISLMKKDKKGFLNFDIKSELDEYDEATEKDIPNDMNNGSTIINISKPKIDSNRPFANPPIKKNGFFDYYDASHGINTNNIFPPNLVKNNKSTSIIEAETKTNDEVTLKITKTPPLNPKTYFSADSTQKQFKTVTKSPNQSIESTISDKTTKTLKTRSVLPTTYKEVREEINELDIGTNDGIRNMEAYGLLSLSSCQFFCSNIKERHKLLNLLFKMTVFHSRWKKLFLFFTECCFLMLYNTIFLTIDETALISSNIQGVISSSIISNVLTIISMYFFPFFFRVSQSQQRKLYDVVISGGQLIVLKEYERLACTNAFFTVIGVLLCLSAGAGTFYFSFGFTAVWQYQANTWVISNVISFIIEFVFCELMMEGLVAFLYIFRKKGKFPLYIGYILNQMRNYRVLWP